MQKRKYIIHSAKYLIPPFFKKREGQSLLEVLVGLTIGAILIGGASLGVSFILKSTSSNDDLQVASGLVRQTLDEIRSYASANWQNIYALNKGTDSAYFVNASGTTFYTIEGKEGVLSKEVADGLVGKWGFDESTGTIAYDISGNGNNGTLTNNPTRATSSCPIGYCVSFDGVNDYVTIPWLTNLPQGSISIWFKSNTSWGDTRIFFEGDGTASASSPSFEGTSSLMRFYVANGCQLNVSYTQGEWVYIVGTWNGSNNYLYLNGVLVGGGVCASTESGFSKFVVGSRSGTLAANSTVDDVRIYNRALSATEIKNLYESKPFSSFFYVENVCRSNDASSTITDTEPCQDGSIVDPTTQKLTSKIEWNSMGTTDNIELTDYLTRWENKVFHQTDWSGGSGTDGPLTTPNTQYSTSTNIDATTEKGLIKIKDI
jgi:type II secretory pathway pseudopilin PulG